MHFSDSLLNLVSYINMSAYHLRKTEVIYELKIRNLPTDGTAGDLRKRLSQSLSADSPIDDTVVNNLESETELEECEAKYQDLSALVSDYEGNHNDNEHHRVVARLWHLYLRVNRIPVGAMADSNLEETKDNLLSRCKELLDSFKEAKSSSSTLETREKQLTEDILKNKPIQPRAANPFEDKSPFNLPKSQFMDEEEERMLREERKVREACQEREDRRLHEQSLEQERRRLEEKWRQEERRIQEERRQMAENWKAEDLKWQKMKKQEEMTDIDADTKFEDKRKEDYRPRPVPVFKWGIKFDNSGPSIASFLERVEELRRARGITHQELYESAVDLFSGPALVWYRAAANRIRSWHQLTRELREVFQPADYDLRLHQEIFNRIQGDNEPLDLYIAAMEGLYNRLATSVPETTRLAQIYSNLHPQLQDRLALCSIESLEQLRSMGRRAEAGRLSMNRQRPSTRDDATLEPDLAYYDSMRSKRCPSGRVAEIQTNPFLQHQTLTCWNCGETGHRFRFCRKPKKRFCFGCGKDNTMKRDCSNCNQKNGHVRGSGTQ